MKLKPPSNIRTIKNKSCANCTHLKYTEEKIGRTYSSEYSEPYCERMGDEFELPCEVEELNITVCDRHTRKSKK